MKLVIVIGTRPEIARKNLLRENCKTGQKYINTLCY